MHFVTFAILSALEMKYWDFEIFDRLLFFSHQLYAVTEIVMGGSALSPNILMGNHGSDTLV